MLQPIRGVSRKIGRLKRILPVNESSWAKLDLLRILVRRDLDARYKGSVLGNLWPLLNQLSQLLIYTYVFSIVLNVKLSLKGVHGNESLTFGLWLFAGLLPWIAFTGGADAVCWFGRRTAKSSEESRVSPRFIALSLNFINFH